MKQSFYFFCILLLFTGCSGKGQVAPSNNGSLNAARQAYWRTNHQEAYGLFTQVWKNEENRIIDRAMAGRYMAKMQWRFYDAPEKAFELLDELDELEEGEVLALLLRARVLADQGKYTEAIVATEKAKATASSDTEKYDAIMGHGRQLLQRTQHGIMQGNQLSIAQLDALEKTYATLQTWMSQKLGDVKVAQINLAYALLLGQGEKAFEAWMAYYRHTDISEVHPSLMKDVNGFKQALDQYIGKGTDEKHVVEIIKGLAESSFYKLAAMMKTWHLGLDKHADYRLNEIVAYNDYRKSLTDIAESYYRETLNGKNDKGGLDIDLDNLGRKLWRTFTWTEDQPGWSRRSFRSEIRKRFKGYLSRFISNGGYGVHLGQVVLDDKRIIRQYKEEAEFRYYLLDHMASNGYSSWFGDGDNEVGGWSSGNGSFLQVRTTMTTAPVQMWQRLTDPKEGQKLSAILPNGASRIRNWRRITLMPSCRV